MKLKNSMILISAVTVAACGGGGGGAELTPTPPAASAPLVITAANGQSATFAAWESAQGSAGLSDLLSNSGFVSTGGQLKPTIEPTTDLVNVVNKIPFGPTTLPCQVSGSITVSGDLADPITPTLTEGDVINVDADNCDDGLGEVLDGQLGFSVDAFEGDLLSGLYNLTMSMTMNSLSVTAAGETLTSSGDATVMLNTLSAPSVSAQVSGSSLTTQNGAVTETLSNFLSAQSVDPGQMPAPYTLSSAGGLDSSRLSGSVEFSTPVTFSGFDNGYPQTGELLVTGASSSARLIALDAVNVRVEIDSDGDGTVDDVIDTTWAELTGET